MSHYFTNDDSPLVTRTIRATIFDNALELETANGVFSGSRLDLGTSVLLRTVAAPTSGHVLDLGCGYGPIAVGLAVASEGITVDAVDVNERALALTARNAEALGVADRVNAVAPDDVAAGVSYDEIWSNPPIRIGKDALHELLLRWLPRLKDDGTAYLVVSKNLGGDSLAAWLTDQGWTTSKLASAKGFRVLILRAGEQTSA
ncbi:class I SAM-dependent methyltransferase [Tessaracoccus antarcticus]|uniref:Methyltransferase domain-containing protein n=1 Tax=Tessaracoccus antarcticus TaxID=2479848 RepID=A0A3M0G066_9ACTN|nr:methyltransferase [Tessaracoccus antarcticus]RMB58324.1 methyltransferase domain-containing protein [Tessaracoccus antarcticus]